MEAGSFDIQGFEELYKKLDGIKEEMSKGIINSALDAAGRKVKASAKQLAPADSGYLRKMINNTVETEAGTAVGYVFTNVEYAPYVEYGTGIYASKGDGRKTPWHYEDEKGKWHTTKGQEPQPFLYPALTQNTDNIQKVMAAEIKKFIGD